MDCVIHGVAESDMTEQLSLIYYLPSIMVRMNPLSVKLPVLLSHLKGKKKRDLC